MKGGQGRSGVGYCLESFKPDLCMYCMNNHLSARTVESRFVRACAWLVGGHTYKYVSPGSCEQGGREFYPKMHVWGIDERAVSSARVKCVR